MNKRLYILLLLGGILLSCHEQLFSQQYTAVYNLHFSMNPDSLKNVKYLWMENAAYVPNNSLFYDLKSYSRKNIVRLGDFTAEFEQRILLPLHKEKEGIVTFTSRGENLRTVSLLLTGIDDKEMNVFVDTLTFVPDITFESVSRLIPLTGVELLNVRIHAEGKHRESAYFELGRLDIKIGNKGINEYSLRNIPVVSCSATDSCISLQTDAGREISEIEAMKDNKIIALGESLHGNAPICDLACKLIMDQVWKRNCRLVIWEVPIERSLLYNRYINDEKFIISPKSTKRLDKRYVELLQDLRKYNSNKSPEDKVQLLGMDYTPHYAPNPSSASELRTSLMELGGDLKLPEFSHLLDLLKKNEENEALNYIELHKANFSSILTSDEVECILHILSLSQSMGKNIAHRIMGRDSVMFVNVNFFLERYSSPQTVIYAHSVHINPVSTYPVVARSPFGKYMKDKYQDDYVPFLLLTGNGEISALDLSMTKIEKKLQPLPKGSIEACLNKREDGVLYLPLTTQFDKLVLSRFKGNVHSDCEFYPYNLYRRYKGVFFVKNDNK